MQGPAEKLIRSLPVTGNNYERAWSLLSRHFENKRELIRSNFAAFTAVPRMKAETAEELTRGFNAITAAVNAQESIDRLIGSHGMDLFNFLVVELFDPLTRLEWESVTSSSVDPPSHDTLTDFISRRILTLNAAKSKSAKSAEVSRSAKSHFTKANSDSSKCAACKGKHSLMQCADFKAKPASERKNFVEANRLCYNCLGSHLMAKCQSVKTCFTCKSRHHTLLHDAYTRSNEAITLSTTRLSPDHRAILLATARVTIQDYMGRPQDVRALIDQGSEISLMSESLAQRLRLLRTNSAMSVAGIGGAPPGTTRGKMLLNLSFRVTGEVLSVEAYILQRLSSYQGPIIRSNPSWPHLRGLPLADPQYSSRDSIELLLGADVYAAILLDGLRKGCGDEPIAQKTVFGWILSGGRKTTSSGQHHSHQCITTHELNDLVQRFWEQDKEPSAAVALTPDEERCEDIFARTHNRTLTGRYMVRLPFSGSPPFLPETHKPAERLLAAMERRCAQDAQFQEMYRSFMLEYENLQHMEEINAASRDKITAACYLPHHGVLRRSSATTKLRVVFNGSQRTSSGTSLNAQLLVGANLLPTLADVLLRWRWHRYALITDVEKMYRQILVHPEDRDQQRIL